LSGLQIPDIAAMSGISGREVPVVNGSNSENKHFSSSFRQHDTQDQSFNIALQRDVGEGIAPIMLVPQDMSRVLLNLFSNGFYAACRRQSMEAAPGFEPTPRSSLGS
jgi:hypothetical protein